MNKNSLYPQPFFTILLLMLLFLSACNQSKPSGEKSGLKPQPRFELRRAMGDAGMGHRVLSYDIINRTDSVLTLYGYPDITLLDSLKNPIKNIKVLKSEGTYFQAFKKPEKVSISPDSSATMQLEYDVIRHYDRPCPRVSYIRISLPGDTNSYTFDKTFNPCGGNVQVTPVREKTHRP